MSDQDLPGQVLQGTYRVVRLIGEGGMGAVYEAAHLRLTDSRVAIKVLSPEVADNATALARFRREAQICSALGHPHIVLVIDFNSLPDGRPYLVMELLEGEDLAALLARKGRLDLPQAASIFRQTASALQAAHRKAVIHRDLKPPNIFLCHRGARKDFVKVVDFGISKVIGSESVVTARRSLIGTPMYMSPEQAEERSGELDLRADVYAMGVILFEMLAGHPPFSAKAVPALLFQIVHGDMPSIVKLRPELPPQLQAVIERATAKRPDDRFWSMKAFWEALAEVLRDEGLEYYEPTEDRTADWLVGPVDDAEEATLDGHCGPRDSSDGAAGATLPVDRALSTRPAGRAKTEEAGSTLSVTAGQIVELAQVAPGRSRRIAVAGGVAVLVAALVGAGLWLVRRSDRPAAETLAVAPVAVRGPSATSGAPELADAGTELANAATGAPADRSTDAGPTTGTPPDRSTDAGPTTGTPPDRSTDAGPTEDRRFSVIVVSRGVPIGCRVVVDGVGLARQRTPCRYRDLRGGAQIRLELRRRGYRPLRQRWNVEGNRTIAVMPSRRARRIMLATDAAAQRRSRQRSATRRRRGVGTASDKTRRSDRRSKGVRIGDAIMDL